MADRTVTHGTFVLERNYPTTAQRVFAAFADPVKKRRWLVEGEGFTIEHYTPAFGMGATESSSFRYQGGPLVTNDTIYQDIVPASRIVWVYTMTVDRKPLSSSLATIELLPEGKGTKLIYTEQGAFFGGADDVRNREEGFRGLLEILAKELADHA